MIVNQFKSNKLSSIIAIILIALILWIPFFVTPIQNITPSFASQHSVFNGIFNVNYFFSKLFSFALLLIGALILNYIVNEHEITSKRSFLPAFIFILFSSIHKDLQVFNSNMVATLLLLLLLNRLLSIYRKEKSFSEIFDAGILIGIATLFNIYILAFFLLIYIALLLFHAFNWREWIIPIIGLLVPYVFVFFIYYVFDLSIETNSIFTTSYSSRFNFSALHYTIGILISVSVIVAYITQSIEKKGATLKTTKSIASINWFFALSIFFVFILKPFSITEFSFLAIPYSIIFANYLDTIKKEWLADGIFVVFIASVFISLFTS